MSFPSKQTYVKGSVGHNLSLLHGTWLDKVSLFNLDGSPLEDDTTAGSGTPGKSPFENLVYIDFTDSRLTLTNVHISGRDSVAKTFAGSIIGDLLVFDSLGKGAYENIGMSGGEGILTFSTRALGKATNIYLEPDFIYITAPGKRTRHTVLYRNGVAQRTLTAHGSRLSDNCQQRHELDPRGLDGDVHEAPFKSTLWEDS